MDEEREMFTEEQDEEPVMPEDWAEEEEAMAGEEEVPGELPPAADEQESAPAEPAGRDFHGEALELLQAYPHLRGKQLPGEVLAECARGARLLDAYRGYETRESQTELARVRRENEILRHNAEAARRGPVSGVSTGGGVDTRPSDPFLDGFSMED